MPPLLILLICVSSHFSFISLAAAAAKSLQSCPTLCNPRDGSPPGFPRPWDSAGKNNGVGCHFLLQCMKVKSESEVAQSCLTLCNPMDCSPPGSSAHGILQARVLEWVAISFSSYIKQPTPQNFMILKLNILKLGEIISGPQSMNFSLIS